MLPSRSDSLGEHRSPFLQPLGIAWRSILTKQDGLLQAAITKNRGNADHPLIIETIITWSGGNRFLTTAETIPFLVPGAHIYSNDDTYPVLI